MAKAELDVRSPGEIGQKQAAFINHMNYTSHGEDQGFNRSFHAAWVIARDLGETMQSLIKQIDSVEIIGSKPL